MLVNLYPNPIDACRKKKAIVFPKPTHMNYCHWKCVISNLLSSYNAPVNSCLVASQNNAALGIDSL